MPTGICQQFLCWEEIKVTKSHSTWKMDFLLTVAILMPLNWVFNPKVIYHLYIVHC